MHERQAFPELFLQLDKPRKIVFNLGAWCALEEELGGRSIFQIFDFSSLKLSDIRLIIWAALLGGEIDDEVPQPERVTLSDVDKLIRFETIFENFDALKDIAVELMNRAMPALSPEQREKVEEQKKTILQNLTGSQSGRSESSTSASSGEPSGS